MHVTLRLPDGRVVDAPLPLDRAVVIGRRDSCDLVADDPSVSGRHAEVTYQSEGVVLRDLGSRFGTTVDGTAIEHVVLQPDTTVWLGDVALSIAHPACDGLRQPEAAPVEPPPPEPTKPRMRPEQRFALAVALFGFVVLVAVAALFFVPRP